ncbi:MAG: urease accessory protein UreH [candidate division NC10 bacterium RIFCSPLOWO2_12_FULL_66_18]|nr:MAG: urease accessory protein UreH [candidate division NC10 bacterium RIFCSPLOWO2_02_FULL_66_22]OGC02387.1 MAG: urease accessory protein UreH [candidate division NC10 bacterium RIFCSPLOWO2_12_FULL_66_18]
MEPSPVTTLALGFLLGMGHALDADHVIAVSTMVSRHRTLRRSSVVGIFWGLGHTTTLFLVGVAVILFKVRISDRLALSMEFAVGIVLVALGASVVWGFLGRRVHAHAHRHGGEIHVHFHSHAAGEEHDHKHPSPNYRRSLLVGMLHGLAGSAALMLLVLATIRTPMLGLVYILVFGAGSILGMLGISSLLGLPFMLTAERHVGIHRGLRIAAGAACVVYGIWITFSVGIGQGLLQ